MLEPIQMVWVGKTLGRFDILSMKSFMANGHPVHLYAYDEINNVPEGVIVLKGDDIVSEEKVFKHENSYAAFADLFRWVLLNTRGGIYSDTDVICLKPLDLPYDNYVGYEINGVSITPTIMKFNPDHYITKEMEDCALHPLKSKPYDTISLAKQKRNYRLRFWKKQYAIGWGETAGPIALTRLINYTEKIDELALKIKDLKLLSSEVLYPICYNELDRLIKPSNEKLEKLEENSYTIHLWNEMWRRNNIDKNQQFSRDSIIGQLIVKYE